MLLWALVNVPPYSIVDSPQQREHCLITIFLPYSDREVKRAMDA